MKISVIVPGRLHGFDMALYFQKLNVLNELVTGYPKRFVVPFGIKKRFVKSLYINEIINRTTNFLGFGYPLDFVACESFDYLASRLIKLDSDVYFIWSGYALKTIKTLRKKNPKAKIILVRGSAHIEEQERLLQEVNWKNNHNINLKIIDKELKEYEAVDYITVPSTFAKKTFIERDYPIDKLFLNFLGVDLEEFQFKSKLAIKTGLNIGCVGTISSRKNISSIIKVIAEINYVHEDKFRLYLTGPIDHKTFDSSILKSHKFITYKGIVDQSKLQQVYSEIDLFILNSVEDGFGMVLLQAMACGCPILATSNSGGPDVIKEYENGITIPILDEKALKDAILWFYENRGKIPEMRLKSKSIVEKGFTWDDFGKRNIDFINKIIKH